MKIGFIGQGEKVWDTFARLIEVFEIQYSKNPMSCNNVQTLLQEVVHFEKMLQPEQHL